MTCNCDIKSLTHKELLTWIKEQGQPAFRAKQIRQWLFQKNVSSFDEMTNIPQGLQEKLKKHFRLSLSKIMIKKVSVDGTRKYLLELDDNTYVETVGIPSTDNKHLTVCFSTQAGCAMGCIFCATGNAGFKRNLTISEMVDQINIVSQDFNQRVSNVVAMGQGEPFANYKNLIETLHIFNSKDGLEIGARHITVSTCGIFNGIEQFSHEPEQFTLAVSLHSAIQKTRDIIMPGLKGQSLLNLKEHLEKYSKLTKRRPSLEYALIKDLNDDEAHLKALIKFCSGMLSHVNLIPLNKITTENSHTSNILQPSDKLREFQNALTKAHIEVSIRNSRGADIDGACGQLHQRTLS